MEMTQYFWLASVFGVLGLLVCCAGLAIGASMLWSVERRGATFLWVAMALFILRGIATPVLLAVVNRFADPELSVMMWRGVDAAISIAAWLALTGALVVIARTLREPGRMPQGPATRGDAVGQ